MPINFKDFENIESSSDQIALEIRLISLLRSEGAFRELNALLNLIPWEEKADLDNYL
jgi:hypothetical protein